MLFHTPFNCRVHEINIHNIILIGMVSVILYSPIHIKYSKIIPENEWLIHTYLSIQNNKEKAREGIFFAQTYIYLGFCWYLNRLSNKQKQMKTSSYIKVLKVGMSLSLK